MGATYDDKEVHEEMHTSPKGWTTIVLDELDDGRWLATQGGVVRSLNLVGESTESIIDCLVIRPFRNST